jgi:hypothetical protein
VELLAIFRLHYSFHVQEQAFRSVLLQQLVIDSDHEVPTMALEKNVPLCEGIFIHIPFEYTVDLPAAWSYIAILRVQPAVEPKQAGIRIIADVTGVDNYEILPVLGVRTMPVRRDHSSYPTMIKWEGSEMFRDQNDGVPLASSEQKALEGRIFPRSKPSD